MHTELFGGNRRLIRRVAPIVGAVLAMKIVAHLLGIEFLSLNPLFTGLVAANVFLLGFLLTGVLSDFKESEKMPGELAASIETMFDEALSIYNAKQAPAARECMERLQVFLQSTYDWFYKKEHTAALMQQLQALYACLGPLDAYATAPAVVRLKNEQHMLRRMILRVHTIRETSFVSSGYIIAEATTFLLTVGLILSAIEPFTEALFFVAVISFLLLFMVILIKDLDNPFGYYEGSSTEDVSLKPLEDLAKRLKLELPAEMATDSARALSE